MIFSENRFTLFGIMPQPASQEIKIMRILALAGTIGLALVASSQIVTTAEAFPNGGPRYCSSYRGTTENCGFYSFQQCLAAVSGVGGMCVVAPMQYEVRTVWTPRGPRRLIRDAID